MKTIVQDRETVLKQVSEAICSFIREKPNAVFTMAAGRTMLPLWKLLGEAVSRGEVSFAEATFFQTAEFLDVPEEKSLRNMTEENFLAVTDLKPEHCHWITWITEDNLTNLDNDIPAAGGLDLAVLGIGDNAHIGFNEPATQYDTRCRVQKLTDKTRAQYSWLFGSAEEAPEKACTMGIHTLIEAKKIIVLALGEEKAQATFDMLYARDDSVIPAAFLQLPFDVTVYADSEAGKKL